MDVDGPLLVVKRHRTASAAGVADIVQRLGNVGEKVDEEAKGIGTLDTRQAAVFEYFTVEVDGADNAAGGLPAAHRKVERRTPRREVGDRFQQGEGNVDEMPRVIEFHPHIVSPGGRLRHNIGLAIAAEALQRRIHGEFLQQLINGTGGCGRQVSPGGEGNHLMGLATPAESRAGSGSGKQYEDNETRDHLTLRRSVKELGRAFSSSSFFQLSVMSISFPVRWLDRSEQRNIAI